MASADARDRPEFEFPLSLHTMSRHRLVRNLNLHGDLDDDALSDGGEDDMTPEQHLQLATAATKVREVLGPEDQSGVTDQEISDTVWNLYFDVEASVDALLSPSAATALAYGTHSVYRGEGSQGSRSATQR